MPGKEDKIVVLSAEKFPSNSKKSKDPNATPNSDPRPRRPKIATAKRIKQPFYKRFANTFIEGETGHDVLNYITYDVVIPAAKSTLADLVEGAIDMVLFGGERGGGRGRNRNIVRSGGRSYMPYNSMYEGSTRGRRDDGRSAAARRPFDVEPGRTAISRRGVESIVLGSRNEAEIVLGELVELVSEFGVASLADLYDLCGLSSEFTDNKYGWTDLPTCTTRRVREGWVLELPRPVIID